jgi:TPP-dependent pyruvate/acetoin dehydrogenase alpha subunit
MEFTMTPEELIAFEEDIAQEFNAGKIKAPVHLYSGGEHELIEIFKDIKPHDWVLCSWRSHYQCLLKGVPPAELKEKIMQGSSIALNFPKYKIVSSAIIGGILPIAVGLGMSIKRGCFGQDPTTRVHAFLGDMTAETGIFWECLKYVKNFDLPVFFHVEDNNLSVCTDTRLAWGLKNEWGDEEKTDAEHYSRYYDCLTHFRYEATRYPHAGAGKRVNF